MGTPLDGAVGRRGRLLAVDLRPQPEPGIIVRVHPQGPARGELLEGPALGVGALADVELSVSTALDGSVLFDLAMPDGVGLDHHHRVLIAGHEGHNEHREKGLHRQHPFRGRRTCRAYPTFMSRAAIACAWWYFRSVASNRRSSSRAASARRSSTSSSRPAPGGAAC